ncbi:uncharacterized protein (TIGR02217 family) [Roseiarcus fermentans]|uniref:Uncharacterized protein (TIGR02217 family) n=1 Tax=Roseiarcus fermentans TaxID=1473586 RepID=A0A366EQL9_9HYPH|nr:DUF2460 domain-containing protein [Roseiarcus fermentans]RBP03799.1 uncharacterized protein (TIGR02217 family) [Roseiarcus fermentans]
MTTPPSFPTLAGLGWSVHKKPTFSTIIGAHASGREVRTPLYVNPIWTFEVTIDGLSSSATAFPGLGANSQQALLGFFLGLQGKYGTFLFTDPTDSSVTAGALGTGDGTTTTFTFARYMGAFLEPVGWVTAVSNVYLNGVNQASGWSLTTPNSLVFSVAPGAAVAITATFTFAFQCRFDDDAMDFEQFMSNLWKVDKITFRSVRAS